MRKVVYIIKHHCHHEIEFKKLKLPQLCCITFNLLKMNHIPKVFLILLNKTQLKLRDLDKTLLFKSG